jgi:hypothetical protein
MCPVLSMERTCPGVLFGEKYAASFGKTRRKFSAASARYAPLSFLVFNAGSRGIQVHSYLCCQALL